MPNPTDAGDLQALCDRGQELLERMDYLAAEAALVEADALATSRGDFDTLARLYMPLQEARRQRRQRCGEGTVCLDLWAEGPADAIVARHVAQNYPHGQLLIAGWASVSPAVEFRKLAKQHALYAETYLAAAYPVGAGKLIVIVPTADVAMPPADAAADGNVEALLRKLPPHSLTLAEDELPRGAAAGTDATFARTMSIWERLHAPYLAAADAASTPQRKIAGYRETIAVDYAAEKAHQRLSGAARKITRQG